MLGVDMLVELDKKEQNKIRFQAHNILRRWDNRPNEKTFERLMEWCRKCNYSIPTIMIAHYEWLRRHRTIEGCAYYMLETKKLARFYESLNGISKGLADFHNYMTREGLKLSKTIQREHRIEPMEAEQEIFHTHIQ